MTTTPTPTSGAADLPEALRRSTAADGKTELFNLPGYPLMVRAVDFNRIHAESEMRRAALLDEMQKTALAAGQATAAPENIRGILARCRDFIDATKAPAYPAGADLADEIVVLLAAQPAPQPSHVAQAVVQDDLITLRKPTTSAELLWLLKLAHLVISDVDKTLEETFAPAQPAAQQPHRSGCTAGTDEECVQRGCGTNCPAVSPRQGAAYAALPTSNYAGRVSEEGFLIGTCPLYTADQLHAFADATYALRASRGQAPAGADEYPALVCDYCGALTPDPWHSSGMLHGKMSKHIHSCDACAAREVAKAQASREQLTRERIQDLLLCGNPTDEEMRLIRIGWDAAHGIKGGQHGDATPQPTQPDPAYSAACNLATSLFKKHFAHLPDFASGQAVWSLCDSTVGVILQIDNMVAGLVQPPTTSPQADSVQEDAARYRFLRDGEWRDTDLEPFIRLQLNTLWDAKIDAARKQGEKQ